MQKHFMSQMKHSAAVEAENKRKLESQLEFLFDNETEETLADPGFIFRAAMTPLIAGSAAEMRNEAEAKQQIVDVPFTPKRHKEAGAVDERRDDQKKAILSFGDSKPYTPMQSKKVSHLGNGNSRARKGGSPLKQKGGRITFASQFDAGLSVNLNSLPLQNVNFGRSPVQRRRGGRDPNPGGGGGGPHRGGGGGGPLRGGIRARGAGVAQGIGVDRYDRSALRYRQSI